MGLLDDVTPALVTETDARAAVQDAEVRFSDGTLRPLQRRDVLAGWAAPRRRGGPRWR